MAKQDKGKSALNLNSLNQCYNFSQENSNAEICVSFHAFVIVLVRFRLIFGFSEAFWIWILMCTPDLQIFLNLSWYFFTFRLLWPVSKEVLNLLLYFWVHRPCPSKTLTLSRKQAVHNTHNIIIMNRKEYIGNIFRRPESRTGVFTLMRSGFLTNSLFHSKTRMIRCFFQIFRIKIEEWIFAWLLCFSYVIPTKKNHHSWKTQDPWHGLDVWQEEKIEWLTSVIKLIPSSIFYQQTQIGDRVLLTSQIMFQRNYLTYWCMMREFENNFVDLYKKQNNRNHIYFNPNFTTPRTLHRHRIHTIFW